MLRGADLQLVAALRAAVCSCRNVATCWDGFCHCYLLSPAATARKFTHTHRPPICVRPGFPGDGIAETGSGRWTTPEPALAIMQSVSGRPGDSTRLRIVSFLLARRLGAGEPSAQEDRLQSAEIGGFARATRIVDCHAQRPLEHGVAGDSSPKLVPQVLLGADATVDPRRRIVGHA